MFSKRLGLGILTTLAATTLAACDQTTAPTAAQPQLMAGANMARNGKTSTAKATRITISPTDYYVEQGGNGWLRVDLYDGNGNLVDGSSAGLWYTCTPLNAAMQSCMGNLRVEPMYPDNRNVRVTGLTAGEYSVEVNDGNGHRATGRVVVD